VSRFIATAPRFVRHLRYFFRKMAFAPQQALRYFAAPVIQALPIRNPTERTQSK
jgi:hypothetical protein